MKKLIILAIIIVSFAGCNNGDETCGSPGNPCDSRGCRIINLLGLTPEELSILDNNGFKAGDDILWNNLNKTQQNIFISLGMDSTLCYVIQ